jgi:hypothetical protein
MNVVASIVPVTAATSPSIGAIKGERIFDPVAALIRAEGLVRCLSDSRIADGFILDEASVERMLHYLRKEATKKNSATDEEFAAVADFCHEYGQSLDWLFFGDPGVMICRAAGNSTRTLKIAQTRKREALKGRGPSQFDLYRLPFFDQNAPISTRCWTVVATGNYTTDCDTGAAYAIEFLRSCDGTYGWQSLMACIVKSMISAELTALRQPRRADLKSNGIIVGFMSVIGTALNWQNVTPDVADALEQSRAKDKEEQAILYTELGHPKLRHRIKRVS